MSLAPNIYAAIERAKKRTVAPQPQYRNKLFEQPNIQLRSLLVEALEDQHRLTAPVVHRIITTLR